MFAHTALEPTTPSVSFDLVEEINHRVTNEYSEAIATLSIAASRTVDGKIRAELAKAAD
jgi:two-component sensor histidine kinase